MEKYLDTGEFSRRRRNLAKRSRRPTRRSDKRMKRVFDHNVSKLAKKPGEAAVPTGHMTDEAAPAAAIVMPPLSLGLLFGDPDAIRQAIIVSEMLAARKSAVGFRCSVGHPKPKTEHRKPKIFVPCHYQKYPRKLFASAGSASA